jgi:ribosomal protein S27E
MSDTAELRCDICGRVVATVPVVSGVATFHLLPPECPDCGQCQLTVYFVKAHA